MPALLFHCLQSNGECQQRGAGADYQPGDVVTWDLGGGTTHIGLVTNRWSDETGSYLIAHNIGGGVRVENVLFSWRITGHYRYF